MPSALTPTAPLSADTHKPVITGFRLGEDDLSDASDSDQSAQSERSLPAPLDAAESTTVASKKSKSMKRRQLKAERRQVNALTDDLGTLLGDAFQAPAADAGIIEQADDEQAMEVETATDGRKMSKRTRQNLAKAMKRRAHHEHQGKAQIAAADRRNMPLDVYRLQQSQTKQRRSAAQVRREKNARRKAKKAAAQEDAMEIG